MNTFKAKLLTTLLGFGLLATAVVGFGVMQLCPTFEMGWFIIIALFFLVFEPIVISVVESSSRKKTQKQLINVYMLTKVIRIIPALFFVLAYVFIDGKDTKTFALIFVLFYFIYLIIETLLFVRIEKHIKSLRKDEQPG